MAQAHIQHHNSVVLLPPANKITDPHPNGVSLFIAVDGGRKQGLAKNQRSKLRPFSPTGQIQKKHVFFRLHSSSRQCVSQRRNQETPASKSYFAWGCDAMKSTADLMESIFSASLSGISKLNSSSKAMTISTLHMPFKFSIHRTNANIAWQWKCHCNNKTIKRKMRVDKRNMKCWHVVHHTNCHLKFLTVRNKIQCLYVSQPYKRYLYAYMQNKFGSRKKNWFETTKFVNNILI